MTTSWLRARLSSAMVVLLWPAAGRAQEAQPAAPVEDARPVETQIRQLEAEPGLGEPPRKIPAGPAADDLKLFVARIAGLRGVTDPALLESIERYYRRRRVGIERGVVGTYRFIEGRPGRVVPESHFIGSYRSVTGSAYLERFAPDKAERVISGVLVAVGALTAFFGAREVLSCAERRSTDYCSSEPAVVAGGGLLVGILGLVRLTMSEPSPDPTIHRIPLDTAETVVPIYNRALLERAITELQRGNPGALEASHWLPPRRRAPSPPETTVGLGPRGLMVRF